MKKYYSPNGNFEVWDIKPEGYYTPEEWNELNKPKPLPLEEQIEQAYNTYNTNIENMLDKFAKTRNYKNIESACSYYNSTNEKFRNEAIYCSTIRDAIYTKCYELLDVYIPKVMSGEIAIPTWEEIKSQLPELKWPDEV